jgi:hypothetical protein
MKARSAIRLLFALTSALFAASCNDTSDSFVVICGPIKSAHSFTFSESGYTTKSESVYKWKPVISVDREKGTLVFANSFDNGKTAKYPRIATYMESAPLVTFEVKIVDPTKVILDLEANQLMMSSSESGDGYWTESRANGGCKRLNSMPKIIYEQPSN